MLRIKKIIKSKQSSIMKNKFLRVSTVVAGLMLLSCNTSNNEAQEYKEKEEVTLAKQIERGNYLVNTSGCNDCHSPKKMTDHGPVPDPDRLLSGHDMNEPLPPYDKNGSKGYVLFNMNGTASIGPWGTSFAGNLTPDDTGIGNWSEEQFLTAIRKGKYKGLEGSRQLLPPMPWPAYAQMSDEDLKAIFAYLQSLKPVENIVPQAVLPAI